MRSESKSKLVRIALTSGDIDGIGFEVTAKALAKIKPQKNVVFYLWRSPKSQLKYLKLIDQKFKRVTVRSWQEALSVKVKNHHYLVDIESNLSPAKWVEISAQACQFGHLDGLATAPLSKTLIQESGMKDLGHTDILKRVSGVNDLFMTFVGKRFNVLVATGHIPLEQVPQRLNRDLLSKAIHAAEKLKKILSKKPLAVLGLNPHAGESGLIGTSEKDLITPLIEDLKKQHFALDGPLVPDAAFLKKNWSKYSVFVALYHDQGLIPFKAIHGQDSGVHLTMGLPFVRTSVDHGTAKDIFGRNKANPQSMCEAIEWCIKLCRASSFRQE